MVTELRMRRPQPLKLRGMVMMPVALSLRADAPEPVAAPRALLALLAAVLGPPAAPALGKLARVLFPFAALP
ncbi:hypothetical protein LTR28_001930, partial [Elasticomyces elasticus]